MPISQKSMFYNISLLSVSGVLLQAMGFAYQVIISRAAGAEALGVFQLVSPVYSVVMAGTLSGVRIAVTSLSAGMSPQCDMPRIRALVRRSILTFVGLFACVGIPVVMLHDFIAVRIIKEPRTSVALVIILCCVFFTGFEGIFESLFLGIGRTKYTAVSNLLEQVVKIAAILLLLKAWGRQGDHARTAALIATGMAFSELPVIVWLVHAYRREIRAVHGAKPAAAKAPRSRVLPVALPVCMSSVVTTLISSASVVLLPLRLQVSGMTKAQAVSALGVVSEMALPLIMLPMVLIRAMANVLLPNISMSMARRNRANIQRKIQKSFQATGLIVLPATAILVPLCTPLARILYRQELAPAYVLLLAVAAVITYYEMISASILNGLGRQKMNMVCLIVGEGIQLACTYFLAARPELGIYGYIAGMVLGPLAVLMMSLSLIKKYTGFSPRFLDSFLIPLLASGVAGGFTRYFYVTMGPGAPNGLVAIGVAAVLGGAVCVGTFFLAGLRPVRYFKTLLIPGHRD